MMIFNKPVPFLEEYCQKETVEVNIRRRNMFLKAPSIKNSLRNDTWLELIKLLRLLMCDYLPVMYPKEFRMLRRRYGKKRVNEKGHKMNKEKANEENLTKEMGNAVGPRRQGRGCDVCRPHWRQGARDPRQCTTSPLSSSA